MKPRPTPHGPMSAATAAVLVALLAINLVGCAVAIPAVVACWLCRRS